jgi:O-antigen/teichoic acid export membrane protein
MNLQVLLRDGIWVTGGQVAAAFAAIVSVRVFTEMMSPAAFGQYNLLLGVVVLAQAFVAGPWAQAILRFLSRCGSNNQFRHLERLSAGIVLGCVAAVSLIFSVIWLAAPNSLGGSWQTGLIMSGLLLIESGRSLGAAFLNGLHKQRALGIWTGIDAWLRLCLAMAAIWKFGVTPANVLLGFMGASAVALIPVAAILLRHNVGTASSIDPEVSRRDFVRYALPLIPLAIVGWASAQSDRYIVGGLIGVASAGLYAGIYGIVSRPFLLVGSSVELTARPHYYAALARGDTESAGLILRHWLWVNGTIGAAGFAAFAVLCHPIAYVLLAPLYRPFASMMIPIALGYGFLIIGQMYERICYAHDDTRAVLAIETFGAVLSIALVIPMAWRLGIWGAALAVPIYFLAQMLLAAFMARSAVLKSREECETS